MKNAFIIVTLFLLLISCGSGLGEKKEHQISNLGLSITIPGDPKLKPLPVSEACEFYIDKSRFNIAKIDEKRTPTDLAMLKEAMKANENFKGILEEKTLPNGAFGIIYEENGKSKTLKEFVFYFKKDGTSFQITPVFGNGTYYEEAIEAIGSLK